MADLSVLSDPCPLPDKEKKRSLDERERLIYAPMAGVGGVVYDKVPIRQLYSVADLWEKNNKLPFSQLWL